MMDLFDDVLHGKEIPFITFLDEFNAGYDKEYDEIFVEGTGLDQGELGTYAALFAEKDGWVGGDISSANGLPEGTAYSFLAQVPTDEGARYVYCVFYGVEYDEEEETYVYSNKGEFRLEAYDPYYYSWPTDAAQYFAWITYNDELVEEPTPVPAFEGADYYSVSAEDGAIYCFVESDGTDDHGYGAILKEAGWDVLEEKDDFGYYVAVSPNQDYQLAFLYDSEFGDLDIFFEAYEIPPTPYESWQDDQVAAMFAAYDFVGVPYEVPSIDVEGGTYYFYEDRDNFWAYLADEYDAVIGWAIVEGAKEADFTAYLEKAEGEGWVAEKGEASTSLSKDFANRTAHMEASFDEESGTISLAIGLISHVNPYETWPEAEILEQLEILIDKEGATPLPAFTGENLGFLVNGNIVHVLVEADKVHEAAESYGQDLINAGFEYVEEDLNYVDPNGEYFVVITELEDRLEIYCGMMPEPVVTYDEWPTDVIAETMGELTTPIPALEGADQYRADLVVSDDDIFGEIQCLYENVEDQSAIEKIASDYNAALLEQGFTVYDHNDELDIDRYVSPEEEYVIYASVDHYEGYSFVIIRVDNLVGGVL